MKVAKSSATGYCRSAIMKRSRRRWEEESAMSAAAVDRQGDGRRHAGACARARCRPPSTASRSTAARCSRATRSLPSPAIRDGHDFVASARAEEGAGLQWSRRSKREQFGKDAPLVDCGRRARRLARSRPRRARAHERQGDRGHRLGRQDLAPRKRSSSCLSRAGPNPRLGRVLQQSLGRAALARALSGRGAIRGVRMGMNHAGEIGPLAQLVRPHIAIITGDRAGASGIFQVGRRASRMPRRKSSKASSPAASRSSIATMRSSTGLQERRARRKSRQGRVVRRA